jgi:hypothetical protein
MTDQNSESWVCQDGGISKEFEDDSKAVKATAISNDYSIKPEEGDLDYTCICWKWAA